jgi:hypothetical protein
MKRGKAIGIYWLVLLCLSYSSAQADDHKPKPFEFKDGDRVVFLGSTWIEREQLWGYWETALTTLYPDKKITFRNLGRSGDTVWGDAWAGFDSPKEGYQRRLKLVKDQKPTVIFLGFGWNESFAGSKGIADFQKQYKALLADLCAPDIRFVLMSPFQIAADDWPYSNLKERQDHLKRYGDVVQQVAKDGGIFFLDDVYAQWGPASSGLSNGLPNAAFYVQTAHNLLHELCLGPIKKIDPIVLDGTNKVALTQKWLANPATNPQSSAQQGEAAIQVKNLAPGKYALKIDGQIVHTAAAKDWLSVGTLQTTPIWNGPSVKLAEELRQAIIEKNQLFFHRSRPQNETYLFGFRKYEQGQNAKEVPKFDPLIEAMEKKIDELKKPRPHTYELVRIGD